jgi:hypothetical protein
VPSAVTTATVQGPVTKVPCAHCGVAMDCSDLMEQLDRGASIECDHCSGKSEVVDIRKVIVVRQA